MSLRILTKKELSVLCNNPNVTSCTNKSITYSPEFKVNAVKEYVTGIKPEDIFTKAGFDISIIGEETPRQCLIRWMGNIKNKGLDSLKNEQRGVKKSKSNTEIESQELKRLKLELEYVKAERDFFAKLRAEGK